MKRGNKWVEGDSPLLTYCLDPVGDVPASKLSRSVTSGLAALSFKSFDLPV